ncbi:MAG: MFS transporter [Simkaniaceae bacterium]|nr:MFS transporter [Simkaniaceae bacterium]
MPKLRILIPLMSFASVSAVLFTPALPAMTEIFQVSDATIQYSMTLFIIGYSLGFLPLGPLSARFGRKPVLVGGLLLATISTLTIILAANLALLWLLFIARFFQAIGACAGMMTTVTMIGDSFEKEQAARALSLATLSFAIVPGCAIFLGGVLTEYIGWQSCFYFLSLYGLIFIYLSKYLPETLKEKKRPSLIAVGATFRNKPLLYASIAAGFGSSCIYVYSTAGPFIGIDIMQLTPAVYGMYNLIPAIGMLIGALTSAKLSQLQSPMHNLIISFTLIACGTMWMLLSFIQDTREPLHLFLPMFLIYCGNGINFPAASSLGLSHASDKAYASGTLNFVNMGVVTLFVLSLSLLPLSKMMLLPSILIFVTLGLAVFWGILKNN